jgi:phosphatidylinositol alpha-1,6-mannosyltransferase
VTTMLLSEIFPPQVGGSGRFYWEVYRRLSREAYLVAVGEHPEQDSFDPHHDLRVERLPLTMPRWGLRSLSGLKGYARALRRLVPLVRAERVDMIHCGRCLPEGLMALALRRLLGIPYVCYAWGEDINVATTSRELAWLARRTLSNAAFVITCSRNTERLLIEEWDLPPRRVRLLHPGVDTLRFAPAPRNPTVREELGWGDRPVILTVGRLQKRKGFDQMIRALRTVRERVPNVLYAIVGDGEEREGLLELVRNEGASDHVQLLGEFGLDDPRLIRCFQQCDLFVLPNRQVGVDIEGFGMVLLEAQACGKPVIAGASGGTSEAVNAPDTGLVVPCETPEGIAAAVAPLLRDESRREAMGRAAREWVAEKFDWPALAVQAGQVFDSLARRAA